MAWHWIKPANILKLTLCWSLAFSSIHAQANNKNNNDGIAAKVTVQTGPDKGEEINVILPKTDKETLKQFSPEEVQKAYQEKMEQAKRSNIFVETTKQFPVESAAFFAAIGLVMSAQLVMSYADNPVALEHHVQSLHDPITHISFYNFMLANRAVTKPLQTILGGNKNLRHFIPYMGMSVGMVASHMTAELLYPIKQCVSDLMDRKRRDGAPTPESCKTAYDDFVLSEKIVDMTPGIISLIVSTYLSGAGQKYVTQLASKATAKGAGHALKVVGVEIATTILPGGLALKGGKVLIKVTQLTAFVGIDMIIHPYITGWYRNLTRGSRLNDISTDLLMGLTEHNRNGWKEGKNNLAEDLTRFQKTMKEWRMINQEKVVAAHSAWLEEILSVTNMYNASQQFYSHFIREAQDRKNKPQRLSHLDRVYLLNGIKAQAPPGYDEFPADGYLNSPHQTEPYQLETVRKVAQKMSADLAPKGIISDKARRHEAVEYRQIRDLFASQDTKTIAQGVEKLKATLNPPLGGTRNMSKVYENTLYEVFDMLGEPNPRYYPGEGYFDVVMQDPFYNSHFEDVRPPAFSGYYSWSKLTDYLTYQMACGPEAQKGDKLVDFKWGFIDSFLPPRINPFHEQVKDICRSMNPGVPAFHMYRNMIPVVINGKEYKYQGLHRYLRDRIRPEILSENYSKNNFRDWWNKHVEPQLASAYLVYGEDYGALIEKLLESLHRNDNSVFNIGPVSNGVLGSLRQELRLYLVVLGEIFRQHIKHLPSQEIAQLLTSDFKEKPQTNPFLQPGKSINLLGAFVHNKAMDLSTLLAHTSLKSHSALAPLKSSYIFQDNMEKTFEILASELNKFKIVSKKSSTRENTMVRAVESQTNMKQIQSQLEIYDNAVGMLEVTFSEVVQLNAYQKKIADLAISGIRGVGQEVANQALMIHAASYDPQKHIEKANNECLGGASLTVKNPACRK